MTFSQNPATAHLQACAMASNEAADLRSKRDALAEQIKALINDNIPDGAKPRDISLALGGASDLASDLFGSAINSAEAAAEDGSYAVREHDEAA